MTCSNCIVSHQRFVEDMKCLHGMRPGFCSCHFSATMLKYRPMMIKLRAQFNYISAVELYMRFDHDIVPPLEAKVGHRLRSDPTETWQTLHSRIV